MIIDCHVHIVPDEIRKNRERFVTEKEKEVYLIYQDPKAKMVGAEEVLKVMDEQGVDKAVVFGLPWTSEELYSLNNDYVLDVANRYPERFIPFCCLDVEAKGVLKEIKRCISKGAKGVGELALYNSDFDDEKIILISEIATICKEADIPILLHTNEEVGHFYIGKSPMTLRGLYTLIKNNQDTKWILAHLGGGLPFFAFLKKEAKEVMKNCWFDTAAQPFLYEPSVYSAMINAIGEEKILFGSDFPLLQPKRYFKEFKETHLSDTSIKKILGANLANVISI